MLEPGVDRHEWETEWANLEPLVVDSPAEALAELGDLIERMMLARGFPVKEAEAREAADPSVVAEFLEAQRITHLVEAGDEVDPGDVGAAVTSYRNLYEYLLEDRHTAE